MPHYSQRRSNSYGQNNRRPSNNRNRSAGRGPKKVFIHPSKFVQAAKPTVAVEYVPEFSFAELNLDTLLQKNLTAMGYVHPSPIQSKAIPVALSGDDLVGIANTGTGKTAAFAVPVLQRLIREQNAHAIIIAPTRELAQQIDEQFRQIAQGTGLRTAVLIGGKPMRPQLRELNYRPRVIIGTPGRIKDHMESKSLDLSKFNIVVLDEVDRMLDMGFVHDIRRILSQTMQQKQSLYFSATLDNRVRDIINGFSNNPTHISVKSGDTSDNVDQNVIPYRATNEKIDKLHDVLILDDTVKTLVFDDTHRSVEKLSKELQARGFSAGAIHGGKSQSQRQRALKSFKNNEINVLVATDVAARGLDVSDITHVINFSAPRTYDDYVHRIGRTGRAGKTGYALTFVEG